MTIEEVNQKAQDVYSWSALYNLIHEKGNPNARTLKKFREKYQDLIEYSHFTKNGKPKVVREITKTCPVCDAEFQTLSGDKGSYTCSYACSNTYFRSGENNPNYKGNNYRTVCFIHHEL